MEQQRRAAAQAAKQARLAREALLEQRQRDRCNSVHHAACALRANTIAAVTEQLGEVHRTRLNAANEVKQLESELRRQRDEQRTQWKSQGRSSYEGAVATRGAASSARNNVRENNLSEAHRASAERLDMFRQSAEAQSALNEGKRTMAERVKREAGLKVVRSALSRASVERSRSAAELRKRSQRDMVEAEMQRMREVQFKQAAATRVELEASPDRVRELKGVEARRKAALSGALRSQHRAFEVRAERLACPLEPPPRASPAPRARVLAHRRLPRALLPRAPRAGPGARETWRRRSDPAAHARRGHLCQVRPPGRVGSKPQGAVLVLRQRPAVAAPVPVARASSGRAVRSPSRSALR